MQRADQLVTEAQGILPLVVPLTVTFAPNSIRADQVLREYERFYARLCRLLINNPECPSKRHLLPFAIAFRDDPTLYADVTFALRLRQLMTLEVVGNRSVIRDLVRNVVDYSAKLGRRPGAADVDLFTVLPPVPTRSRPNVN